MLWHAPVAQQRCQRVARGGSRAVPAPLLLAGACGDAVAQRRAACRRAACLSSACQSSSASPAPTWNPRGANNTAGFFTFAYSAQGGFQTLLVKRVKQRHGWVRATHQGWQACRPANRLQRMSPSWRPRLLPQLSQPPSAAPLLDQPVVSASAAGLPLCFHAPRAARAVCSTIYVSDAVKTDLAGLSRETQQDADNGSTFALFLCLSGSSDGILRLIIRPERLLLGDDVLHTSHDCLLCSAAYSKGVIMQSNGINLHSTLASAVCLHKRVQGQVSGHTRPA